MQRSFLTAPRALPAQGTQHKASSISLQHPKHPRIGFKAVNLKTVSMICYTDKLPRAGVIAMLGLISHTQAPSSPPAAAAWS